jgi:hypothetical protein
MYKLGTSQYPTIQFAPIDIWSNGVRVYLGIFQGGPKKPEAESLGLSSTNRPTKNSGSRPGRSPKKLCRSKQPNLYWIVYFECLRPGPARYSGWICRPKLILGFSVGSGRVSLFRSGRSVWAELPMSSYRCRARKPIKPATTLDQASDQIVLRRLLMPGDALLKTITLRFFQIYHTWT